MAETLQMIYWNRKASFIRLTWQEPSCESRAVGRSNACQVSEVPGLTGPFLMWRMSIPACSTSHAHFASIPADPIHCDFHSYPTPKQGGQSDHTIRQATSNMTQIELSITKLRLPPLIIARQPVS
jgi:hypothetical protein